MATIKSELARIAQGRDEIIVELNKIGLSIPAGTPINEIGSYIKKLGVFRGTMTAYETAYTAGYISEGTVVIIDDVNTTAVLGKAILGQMVLGTGGNDDSGSGDSGNGDNSGDSGNGDNSNISILDPIITYDGENGDDEITYYYIIDNENDFDVTCKWSAFYDASDANAIETDTMTIPANSSTSITITSSTSVNYLEAQFTYGDITSNLVSSTYS